MNFSTSAVRDYASQGRLEEWIHFYLKTNNADMADGLKKDPRWYVGPVSLSLKDLQRKCGPEKDMPYPISQNNWDLKTRGMAATFADPLNLPPIIIESKDDLLIVCDGNHRVRAAEIVGWHSLWGIVWFNTEAEFKCGVAMTEIVKSDRS